MSKPSFDRTKKAATVFSNLLCCTFPDCKEKSTELQYLGTACKHAFCWDCINKLTREFSPSCPMCCAPLEVARPTRANMYNNLSSSLDKFMSLLSQYEAAVERESAEGAAQHYAQTQQMFEENFEEPTPRTIDEFISTQTLVQDQEVNEMGLQDSRPNSTELPVTSPVKKGDAVEPELFGALTRSRSRNSRERSTSRPPSGASEELNMNVNVMDARAISPALNRRSVITDSVPKFGVPLASSTQRPNFFMTQEIEKNPNDSFFEQPAVLRPTLKRAPRSFEFVPRPTTSSSEKDRKSLDAWKQTMVSDRSLLPKRDSNLAGTPPATAQFVTPKGRGTNDHKKMPDHQTERGAVQPILPRMPKKEAGRKSGAKPGEMNVINAVIHGNVNTLIKAIQAGCDVNECDPLTGTPLYAAVERNRLEMCKVLVENGAIINAHCGPDCNTALHLAVELEYEDIAQYLLSKGASRQIRNIRLKTPCEMAQTSSPLRRLVEKYRAYPRQPSIPPRQPEKYNVVLEEGLELSDRKRATLSRMVTLQAGLEPSTTHYVVALIDSKAAAKATNSLLFAMLKGIHVVSLDWLDECLKQRELVTDDLRYEVQHVRYQDHRSEGAITKCRRSREKMEPGLLRGCKFYLPHARLRRLGSKAQVTEIIRAAGGEVLSREPQVDRHDPLPFYGHRCRSPYFILYDISSPVPPKLTSNENYILCTGDWLYECLIDFEFKTPY